MAVDETETFLYYTQCLRPWEKTYCQCGISRINIKMKGNPQPQLLYTETKGHCGNLAIIGRKMFFSFSQFETSFKKHQGINGERTETDQSKESKDDLITTSIMKMQLGDSKIHDPVIFESDLPEIEFFTKSPMEPNCFYVGFDDGSKVVKYNIATGKKDTILEDDHSRSQAMIVEDFIIYTKLSKYAPGIYGTLYRKRLGSKEKAMLVANKLASPHTLCQNKDDILINCLGEDDLPSFQKAVVSVSTESVLTSKNLIHPRVLKNGLQSNAMTCTINGTIYYAGYRSDKGIYEIYYDY